MYGGTDGNSIGVTPSGNVGTSVIYSNVKNVGRVVLRTSAPYQLPDCPASWITIYSATTHGNIWLGGITSHVPQANVGYPIVPGASLTLPVTNSNQVSLIPSVDGDTVYIVIGATDSSVPITPGSPAALDKVPPTILSTHPLTGTSSIPINTSISFLASEPLDPNSINNTNITITPFQTGMQIVQDSSNPANILITYTTNLFNFTQYTINVANIADLAGNLLVTPFSFNFTTSNTTVADTTPPSLVSSNPANGATGVSTSASITLLFSEAILPASISISGITVTNVSTGSLLTGYTLSQSSDQKTVTIGSLPLANSTQYRINVYNTPSGIAIKDLAGNLLDNNYSGTFTTVAAAVVLYNVAGNAYSSMNSVNAYIEVDEIVVNTSSKLYAKKPVAFSFILKKVGTPAGSVGFIWRRTSGGTLSDFKTIGVTTANTLGTTDTTVNFSLPTNTDLFQALDHISIRYEAGTATNYVMAKCATPDAFDGANTYAGRVLYDGTASNSPTLDVAGTISVPP